MRLCAQVDPRLGSAGKARTLLPGGRLGEGFCLRGHARAHVAGHVLRAGAERWTAAIQRASPPGSLARRFRRSAESNETRV